MKKKRKLLIFIIACSILSTSTLMTSAATKDSLLSKGRIVFDNGTSDPADDLIFDSTDLVLIADKIDKLATGL